jgi:hypothetical protein
MSRDECGKPPAVRPTRRSTIWSARPARRAPAPAATSRCAARGFVGAAFPHRFSREGDPQIHVYVLVANMTACENAVQGAERSWRTLDARDLYRHQRAAGYLFQAELRERLTRELGVEWTKVHKGASRHRGRASRADGGLVEEPGTGPRCARPQTDARAPPHCERGWMARRNVTRRTICGRTRCRRSRSPRR